MKKPMTLEQAQAKVYGVSFSRPRGWPYRPNKCCQEVTLRKHYGNHKEQCRFDNGHGPEGLYCKKHAAGFEEADK